MQAPGTHLLSVACLLLTLAAAPCRAQLSASVALDSDYRFRGLTQSDGQPDLRLNLSYDHSKGAYAGLSLIAAQGYSGQPGTFGYTAYAGYVSPRHGGLAWEAGITHTHIKERFSYDYNEAYAGVLGDHVSARLSYSPSYYGRHMKTLYAEVNAGQILSPHWRVFAHAGALTPVSGWTRRERYDVRAGVAASLRNYEVQLAWVKTNKVVVYPAQTLDDGEAVIVSASCYF